MSTASDLTQAAKNDFMDRNRDLLALTKNGANDVFKRIAAHSPWIPKPRTIA